MTNLSQERLVLEVEQNLLSMPDKYFQQLLLLVDAETQKRGDAQMTIEKEKMEDNEIQYRIGYKKWRASQLTLADLPDDEVKDADGCYVWLRDHVQFATD
jgi:hypothetical protein